MALDAAHRASIYEKLRPVLGDEDANVLMSEFPSIEAQELVTKDFLRAEFAEFRTELRGEMVELRSGMGELRSEMGELRSEMRADVAGFRTEIAELKTALTVRMGSAIAAGVTVLAATNLLG